MDFNIMNRTIRVVIVMVVIMICSGGKTSASPNSVLGQSIEADLRNETGRFKDRLHGIDSKQVSEHIKSNTIVRNNRNMCGRSAIPKFRTFGGCRCRRTNFYRRYVESQDVVVVYVDTQNLAEGTVKGSYKERVVYQLEAKAVFKGSMKKYSIFKAEAYQNIHICGLQLRRYTPYILFLNKPGRGNVYQLDQCQMVIVYTVPLPVAMSAVLYGGLK